MKTEKITVNKTSDRPDGIEIEIVKPTDLLHGRLLSHLLTSHIRELSRAGRFNVELPEHFSVEHSGEGTFVVSRTVAEGPFYEPPRPVAIVGIRVDGNRFDLVHAQVPPADTTSDVSQADATHLPPESMVADVEEASDSANGHPPSPSVSADGVDDADRIPAAAGDG